MGNFNGDIELVIVLGAMRGQRTLVVIDQAGRLPRTEELGDSLYLSAGELIEKITEVKVAVDGVGWLSLAQIKFVETPGRIHVPFFSWMPEEAPLQEGFLWSPIDEFVGRADELDITILSNTDWRV